MKDIQTTNSKVLSHPAMHIWKAIADLSRYSAWWPSSIKIKTLSVAKELVGSRIEVRPFGGQAFFCEVSEVNAGKELSLKYSGIYTGTGVWTISEMNGQSQVTYTIDLTVNSSLVRLLSSVLPVAAIHARLMEELLTGLERYLDTVKSAQNKAP